MKSLSRLACLLSLPLLLMACSSGQKKASSSHDIKLRELVGQKVALMSLEGEPTAKKIVEVALVNQLVQKGTFELLSKGEVEAAQAAPEQDPTDWKGIATKAGADYILHANVLQFEAPIREGYSKQEVIDTQLAEERGTDGKTEQVYKVKAMNGHVKVRLTFTRLSDDDKRTAVAQADRQIEASAQAGAIHLPPKLRFLEELTNQAFQEFFEKFN